ncbi:cytochrome P450 [Marasmius fiardii PR-910]|nr:cytochrome P450 [Marasmius fiardii PR-910]
MHPTANYSFNSLTPAYASMATRVEMSYKLSKLLEINFPPGPFDFSVLSMSCFLDEMIACILLAVANHAFFHRHEPTRSTLGLTILVLAVQPLLLFLAFSFYSSVSASALYQLLPKLLRICVNFYLSLACSIVLYRVSPFHPLAKVPGPTLAKMSKLWGLWACWTGRQHLINKELHDKYGPVVRVGPNEISTIDLSAVNAVLGASGLPKGQWYSVRQDLRAPKSLLSVSGEEHASRRKLWNRGLSWEALREHEADLCKRVGELSEAIRNEVQKQKGEGRHVDIGKWFEYFTFDFMGKLAFGQGSQMVKEGGDKTGLLEEIKKFGWIRAFLSNVPWLFQLAHKLPFTSNKLLFVRDYGMNCAQRRVQEGAMKKDLWYYLNDEANLEKTKPPLSNVLADGMVAVIAGSDTSAGVMGIVLWCILAHPEWYARVEKEVDAAIGEDLEEGFDYAELASKLPCLEACISESLRLHPVVPTNGPRQVPTGSGGRIVSEFFLPEGTQVYVPPYSIQRNPEYFSPAPDSFSPERWMSSSDGKPYTTNRNAYLAFSFGPANCVGRNLAKMQITLVLALLMKRFRFRFAAGFDWERWPAGLRDFFVVHRDPLYVDIVARPKD